MRLRQKIRGQGRRDFSQPPGHGALLWHAMESPFHIITLHSYERKILARAQLGTALTAEANPLIHGCQVHIHLDRKSVADSGKALCQHSLGEETYWYSYVGKKSKISKQKRRNLNDKNPF